MDEMESDSVCQASAIKAIEPVINPTQYFKINKIPLTRIDIHPTFSEPISPL
jgi:hypothetical protein